MTMTTPTTTTNQPTTQAGIMVLKKKDYKTTTESKIVKATIATVVSRGASIISRDGELHNNNNNNNQPPTQTLTTTKTMLFFCTGVATMTMTRMSKTKIQINNSKFMRCKASQHQSTNNNNAISLLTTAAPFSSTVVNSYSIKLIGASLHSLYSTTGRLVYVTLLNVILPFCCCFFCARKDPLKKSSIYKICALLLFHTL